MRKNTGKVLFAILIVLALAGCRQKTAELRPAAAPASEQTEVIELELFSSKRENVAAMEQLIDRFNQKNPEIRIVLNAPADAETTLKTRVNKGDMPDLIAYGGDNLYTGLTAAGLLADLSMEPSVQTLQRSYWEMVSALNGDGTQNMYGVPFATNASGIIYNKAIFAAHNIAVPKTWTELLAVCEQLKAAGVTPFELTLKDRRMILTLWNSLVPEIQPEDFITRRRAGQTTFLATHREVLEKYCRITEYAQDDFMNTSYADANRSFADGDAAMMINGCWALPEIKKVNPEIELDMFTYPGSEDPEKNKVISGIDVMLAVSAACPEQAAARRFVAFLMQHDTQIWYMEEQFAFSAEAGVNQKDPSVAGILEDIKTGKVADFADHYYPAGLDLSAILSDFLLNNENGADQKQNITDTLKQIDQQYDLFNRP